MGDLLNAAQTNFSISLAHAARTSTLIMEGLRQQRFQ